jgi:DNA repair exonuclease SbcCD ATPase subunit
MRSEADDLERMMAVEKLEAEAAQKRWRERTEKLAARRIEILKKIGDDAADMKRRALRMNPVDPRTTQIKQELEALRIVAERNAHESGMRIKDLTRQLNERTTEVKRLAAQVEDVKRLQEQIRELREKVQDRDRELQAERQKTEELRRSAAASQHALLARLSELESGMPGHSNQSREAHAQASRFPAWRGFKK